jgi:hypothetical protein
MFTLLTDAVLIAFDGPKRRKTTKVPLESIIAVFPRMRFDRPTALEIFTSGGVAYFVNFFDVKALPILRSFRKFLLPKIQPFQFTDSHTTVPMSIVNDWVDHHLSNFEYLMRLNVLSGRTFNDPEQYPILPSVIADYTSATLDLANPATFRDLGERKSGESVSHWLLRLEPFTSLHIALHGGRFADGSLLFQSASTARECSEIPPEFFCVPEFLVNRDGFDLGKCAGDVVLPPWSASAHEFVDLSRKALESDYVSANLQRRIDRVWGERQLFVSLHPPRIQTPRKVTRERITVKFEITTVITALIGDNVGQIESVLVDVFGNCVTVAFDTAHVRSGAELPAVVALRHLRKFPQFNEQRRICAAMGQRSLLLSGQIPPVSSRSTCKRARSTSSQDSKRKSCALLRKEVGLPQRIGIQSC